MSSVRIRKVGSAFCQLLEVKVGSKLSKANLSGHNDGLVRFVTRLDNAFRITHSNWKNLGSQIRQDQIKETREGCPDPEKKVLNQLVASLGFNLQPGRLYKAWP
jgi:hypothetical protein